MTLKVYYTVQIFNYLQQLKKSEKNGILFVRFTLLINQINQICFTFEARLLGLSFLAYSKHIGLFRLHVAAKLSSSHSSINLFRVFMKIILCILLIQRICMHEVDVSRRKR